MEYKYPYGAAERAFQIKYLKWLVAQINPELIVEIEDKGEPMITFVYYAGEKANGISVQDMNSGEGMRQTILCVERSFEQCADFYNKK